MSERAVAIEAEVRVTFPTEPGRLVGILKLLRRRGGRLKAHLVYRLYDTSVGFFICERPEEAALGLKEAGIEVETETVVTVRTENAPDVLTHLAATLEAEKIAIGYSYATSCGEELYAVFRTDDNPNAEDVVRGYLGVGEGVDGTG